MSLQDCTYHQPHRAYFPSACGTYRSTASVGCSRGWTSFGPSFHAFFPFRYLSCGQDLPFFSGLVPHHLRRLYTPHKPGVSAWSSPPPQSKTPPPTLHNRQGLPFSDRLGAVSPSRERCDATQSKSLCLHQQHLPCLKKDGGVSPGDKPMRSVFIHHLSALQGGRHPSVPRPAPRRRLVYPFGPQGCLPYGPNTPGLSPVLQFLWHFHLLQFTCLLFGLSKAPWCFTKLLKPFLVFFCIHGIHSIVYLDDILLFNADLSDLRTQTHWIMDWLQALGFKINLPKFTLVPSQCVQLLGFGIASSSLFSKVLVIKK